MVIILTRSGENVSRYDMSPGVKLNIILVLHNYGKPSTFNLIANVDNATPFKHNISKYTDHVGTNETYEFMVKVEALKNATVGERAKFTVMAFNHSDNKGRSDSTTFYVRVIPPPPVRLCQLK